jgi:hypothetical protein
MTPAATFTAAQIAAALGKKRQAVAYALRRITPVGVQVVSGNQAAAWTLPQLPVELLAQLETTARHTHQISLGHRALSGTLRQQPRHRARNKSQCRGDPP